MENGVPHFYKNYVSIFRPRTYPFSLFSSMNTSAYLKAQGWRGEGFSLDHTNRGIARPLLVDHKKDLAGLGTKKNDFSNQWWLNAFDKSLSSLGSTPIGSPGPPPSQPPKSGLYASFVKAETLGGTYEERMSTDTSLTVAAAMESTTPSKKRKLEERATEAPVTDKKSKRERMEVKEKEKKGTQEDTETTAKKDKEVKKDKKDKRDKKDRKGKKEMEEKADQSGRVEHAAEEKNKTGHVSVGNVEADVKRSTTAAPMDETSTEHKTTLVKDSMPEKKKAKDTVKIEGKKQRMVEERSVRKAEKAKRKAERKEKKQHDAEDRTVRKAEKARRKAELRIQKVADAEHLEQAVSKNATMSVMKTSDPVSQLPQLPVEHPVSGTATPVEAYINPARLAMMERQDGPQATMRSGKPYRPSGANTFEVRKPDSAVGSGLATTKQGSQKLETSKEPSLPPTSLAENAVLLLPQAETSTKVATQVEKERHKAEQRERRRLKRVKQGELRAARKLQKRQKKLESTGKTVEERHARREARRARKGETAAKKSKK